MLIKIFQLLKFTNVDPQVGSKMNETTNKVIIIIPA